MTSVRRLTPRSAGEYDSRRLSQFNDFLSLPLLTEIFG
jgi:hypothetical protein